MKEKVILYYRQGFNCSRCILMAAAETYGFSLPEETLDSCGAVNNGFGIGGICSALVGAVLVFGILFPDERAKFLRLQLFLRFHEKYESLNCCILSACQEDCEGILGDVAELTEELIVCEKECRKQWGK